MKIKNKNVLITGASGGIGRHIAHAIAQQGGNVALLALPSEAKQLSYLEAKLTKLGVKAKSFTADISNSQQISNITEEISAKFGQIDIFISNAAIASMGVFRLQSEQAIKKIIAVNLTAPILITKKLLPQILKNTGQVVVVSSFAGKIGLPYQAVYSATKAGLIKWALAMGREHKKSNFLVISPTYVTKAGMTADMFSMAGKKFALPKIAGEATPRQVANGVVCSILNSKTDMIIGSPLLRFMSAINELFPDMVSRLLKLFGIWRFNRKLAFIHDKLHY